MSVKCTEKGCPVPAVKWGLWPDGKPVAYCQRHWEWCVKVLEALGTVIQWNDIGPADMEIDLGE